MLKMLNGLIKPDRGTITMRGRVGALIALGAGFNPILTGRENIYINGSVLGFTKKEIDEKIDEIIDFAEIREAIDMPVQNYSSGMNVRLGFAVATAMNPDVLILDEVLAVGDVSFRAKCFKRMGNIARDCAIIFVSHDQSQISRICTKAILMESGGCIHEGQTAEVLEQYNMGLASKSGGSFTLHTADAIEAFEPLLGNQPQIVQAGSPLTFELKIKSRKSLPAGIAFVNFIDLANTAVGQVDFSSHLTAIPEGDSVLHLTIDRVDLAQGIYSLNLAVFASNRRETLLHAVNFAQIKVSGEPYMWCAYKMPLGRLEIKKPLA
jgi:lipopolysaccharide transport system ATP-binding protein